MVLYDNSQLVWSSDSDSGPDGGVRLNEAPDMLAAGQYTANIPDRPDLPDGANIK